MFIFTFHLNCVSNYAITNRAMKRLAFLVEDGPKVWGSVIRLCIKVKCLFIIVSPLLKGPAISDL